MTAWDDAVRTAELVRSGEADATEVVDAAIERVEALNPQLNAVIYERFDKARKEARSLPDGPFRGVPLLLKDLHCASAGDPQYNGTRFLRDAGFVENHDGAVVRRFRQAGFVILGRTNVPEFGTTITTEPLSFGATRNPWNPNHSTGGSSGGSAAAVASGMVAVAHASDGGGSIRVPASECGLVGLKPARARVSSAPAGEGWNGASTNGVLTRSVRDAAAVLDVLAGPEVGDPYAAVALAGPLSAEVGRDPGRLRVGFLDAPLTPGVDAHPEAAAAVAGVAALLERLGHHVSDAHPPALEETDFSTHFLKVVAANTANEVADWSARIGRVVEDEELEPTNRLFAAIGRAISAPEYLGTLAWLHSYTRRVVSWWEDDGWDILLTPVLNGTPPELGWLSDPAEGGARVAQLLQYTAQWNVTGQPALSLPLHRANGLPVGVQFVAGAGREDVLVRLGAQLEAAAPWAALRPAVGAA